VLTIDDLPDDDLLAIFDFCVVRYEDLNWSEYDAKRRIEWWQSPVHVCRRWRCLVFGSPRRLNLQVYCIPGTPARETLDVWPATPLHIQGVVYEASVDDVVAVLKHRDRISQINLYCVTTSHIEKLWTAIQVPFPELAALCVILGGESYEPVLPDSILGGSAPRLRYLDLNAVPLRGLSKLLLSATHLVYLYLHRIPHSGYISPEAMVPCLTMLTSLETLELEFISPQSYPDLKSRRPPPPTRSVLPALTKFSFNGVNKYLEDLVSRIDAPRLYRLSTTFFDDIAIEFNTPALNQFISRTPTFGAYNEARLILRSHEALVRLQSHPEPSGHGMVEVKILCQVPNRQLSSLAQICTSSLRLLLTMENLHIDGYLSLVRTDDIENTEWFDLLLPFTAVKNLYLSKPLRPRIAPALQELFGGRTTEVLPALQNVLLKVFRPSEPVQEGIMQFIGARQLTNHPVAISVWNRDGGLVLDEP
jgi:hypothetical protein